MYIDSTNDSPMGGDTTVGDQLAAALEPLMQKYQVDAAFWGHHHSYQRTCPAHNFTCVDETKGDHPHRHRSCGCGVFTEHSADSAEVD